jgi:hypothetical protein
MKERAAKTGTAMARTTGKRGTPTTHHTTRHAPTSNACLISLIKNFKKKITH